jgi:tRNA-specific 2-thiouridylase
VGACWASSAAAGFTVGQRRGLGVPGREPRYVLKILGDTRQIVVGSADELGVHELSAESVTWTSDEPFEAFDAELRIRSRHKPAACTITPTSSGFRARFARPEQAVAPGQAAVVYRGERVVGGGYIV